MARIDDGTVVVGSSACTFESAVGFVGLPSYTLSLRDEVVLEKGSTCDCSNCNLLTISIICGGCVLDVLIVL
jgi:hypothetical protein